MASSPLASASASGGSRSPPASRRKGSPDGIARKSSGSRDFGSSILNNVHKSTSQFKKTTHRRSGSPINWFPRKKTDSYLKRKIKHLQEVDGMHASLDETLGNANPHYTRMAREKIAAREAARKAMEARKAAMVEASWCRILQAARIQNKEAKVILEKAMSHATEAFEEARAMGVMMYDRPDCPRQQYEIESSSHIGGRSTHTITASFQTAFEVDKEVAAAVKKAFICFANSPASSNKEEFKELLWKISQNPDTETCVDSEAVPLSEAEPQQGDCEHEETKNLKVNEENFRSSLFPSDFNSIKVQQSTELVNNMLERLKALHEDELASLAVIVATSGLNAVLQTDRNKYHDMEAVDSLTAGSLKSKSRRYSTAASFMDLQGPKKDVTAELPSLDKFLVKHLSKLEKEVQEAREASRKDVTSSKSVAPVQSQLPGSNAKAPESASDLGSILVKHVSKLEKEILEAKKNNKSNQPFGGCKDVNVKKDVQANYAESEFIKASSEAVPSCDLKGFDCSSDCALGDKKNKDLNSQRLPPICVKGHQASRKLTRLEAAKLEALQAFCTEDSNTLDVGLDKILVKPVHRLEKERCAGGCKDVKVTVSKHVKASNSESELHTAASEVGHNCDLKGTSDFKGSDKDSDHVQDCSSDHVQEDKENMDLNSYHLPPICAKGHQAGRRLTRLEAAKLEALEAFRTQDAGLDKILVKPIHRLEKEKMKASKQGQSIVHSNQPKQGNNVPASESLDQILVKHVSRLEREKMEHIKKGDMILLKKSNAHCTDSAAGGLGDILVKHTTKLEQAKMAPATEESTGGFNPVEERRRAREKELLDAWGGIGLGNSMKPHLSKIERDKAAWRKAEEEQKQMLATGEL